MNKQANPGAISDSENLQENKNWRNVRLKKILSLQYGDNLPTNEREEGEIPVYGANGQVDTHSEPSVNGPGIIIGRKGSIAESEFSEEPFWAIDTTYYISNDETDENLYYLHYLLDHLDLQRFNAASAIPGLNRNDAYNLKTDIAPKPEQRRIASVLYNVDQAIRKTEEIIEQTQRVKKGLMQDLFTEGYYDYEEFEESKYGKIPADWRVEEISEIADNIQAGGTPDTNKEEYYGGDIPWVKTGELKQDVVTEIEQTITKEGFENSTARKFPEGTVLVAMYGATTGATSRLGMEATTNQACCGIQVEEGKVDSYFLHQQLEYFKENLIALSAGSGQQNIRKSIIVNFDIMVPPLDEQEKISEILRNIQEQLNKHRETKERLQRLKKGLMQDLLTGEVRADESVEVLDEVVEVEG